MNNHIPGNPSLPPGCSLDDIERRFGDGDPDVDANDYEDEQDDRAEREFKEHEIRNYIHNELPNKIPLP